MDIKSKVSHSGIHPASKRYQTEAMVNSLECDTVMPIPCPRQSVIEDPCRRSQAFSGERSHEIGVKLKSLVPDKDVWCDLLAFWEPVGSW